MTSDAAIWADLSARLAALASLLGREPDAEDILDRIDETAEALGMDSDEVFCVWLDHEFDDIIAIAERA